MSVCFKYMFRIWLWNIECGQTFSYTWIHVTFLDMQYCCIFHGWTCLYSTIWIHSKHCFMISFLYFLHQNAAQNCLCSQFSALNISHDIDKLLKNSLVKFQVQIKPTLICIKEKLAIYFQKFCRMLCLQFSRKEELI